MQIQDTKIQHTGMWDVASSKSKSCLVIVISEATPLLATLGPFKYYKQKAHAFVGTRAEDRGWPRDDIR